MNRRNVLKKLVILSSTVALLPSCLSDSKKASIALNNLKIDGDDERVMALLAETIIPETDEPGGKTTAAHFYALVMIDDCEPNEKREKFLKGLHSFDKNTKQVAGIAFSWASPDERLAILKAIEKPQSKFSEEVKDFYFTSKHFIVEGYRSSQYFLSKVKPYVLVPGPIFKGCVPRNSQNSNA